jgi:uncharacterized membrane protein
MDDLEMDDLAIVIVCVAPLALRWTLGRRSGRPVATARWAARGLGLAFLYFSLGHFVVTKDLVEMLPPWVPQRVLIIYATGILEACVALALFTKRWRRLGGVVAACMLVLFLPANIYAALHHTGVGAHRAGPTYLWVRVPLQGFLLIWALWASARSPDRPIAAANANARRSRGGRTGRRVRPGTAAGWR